MDPLSVTASIIATLQLSSKVIAYLNDVKDASKDRAQCAIEATNLHSLLTILRFRLEGGDSHTPWYTAVRALSVENGPLDQFRQSLELLQNKMTAREGGTLKKAGKALIWKFEKAEVADVLSTMERLKTLVQVALEMDHFKLSLAIKQSAEDTHKNTEVIKDDTNSIRESIPVINSKIDSLQHQGDLAKRNMLIAWLSDLEFPTQQADIIGRKQEGTGQWFLDAPEFVHWFNSREAKTLFCPGMPGAGKTMIAAIAIDHLSENFIENTGVAYVFCNYKAQFEQNVNSLLAAMLKQLVQVQPLTLDHIARLHDQHATRGTKPTTSEIVNTLKAVVETFSTVYIVVDALDEFQDRDGSRRQFVAHLQTLQKKSDVHLMITSRPLPNIVEDFKNGRAQTLEVRANDDDVKQFVAGQIYRLPKCIQRDGVLQEMVQQKIVEAVNGMFLLALLHVDSLRDKRTKTKVQSTLEMMRTGTQALDEAYENALERINCQLPDDTALAKRGLSWIINAVRPLNTTEICHALAVEPDIEETDLDPDNILDIDELVSVCAGLVIVDEESDIVRLVHYTTQEYFERIRGKIFSNAHIDISSTCLTYLSFNTFRQSTWDNHMDNDWIKQHGLLGYAAQHWGKHVQTVQPELCDSICIFLHDQALLDCAMRVKLRLDSGFSHDNTRITGLHVAAYFGLQHLAEVLLSGKGEKIVAMLNAPDEHGRTPLSLAALYGHKDVTAILLDHGANIEGGNTYDETPLQIATVQGHEQDVELLINRGADVNATSNYRGTALQIASFNGQIQVIRFLLDRGADINAEDPTFGSAIQTAAYKGHTDVVRLLLNEGADMHTQGEKVGDALQRAAFGGHEHIVTLLLENGANINAQGGDYHTALQAAAHQGHAHIIKQLLERGADANILGGWCGSALQAASYIGNVLIVELLIERGANINAQGGNNGNALQAASFGGHVTITRLLIENGADVCAKGGRYGTALQAASCCGYERIVKLLIENGADVNAQGGIHGTALQAAAQALRTGSGHETSDFERVVKFLLENGADVNAEGGIYGSALLTAAAGWNSDIVNILLENNANANVKGGPSGSFLNAASLKGWKDVLQLVNNQGRADLHALDSHGRSLLHLAAKGGHLDTFQYLIELGLDLTVEDAKGDGLLSYACLGGSLSIVDMVLKSSALSWPSKHWDPLHWACRGGQAAVVDRLLQEGFHSKAVHVSQPQGDWSPMSIAIYHQNISRLNSLTQVLPDWQTRLSTDNSTLESEELCEGKYCWEICNGCFCGIYGLCFHCRTCPNFKYCFMCKSFLDHVHEGHEIECIEGED